MVADIAFRTLAFGGRSRKAGALVAVLAVVALVLAPYAALLLPHEPLPPPRVPRRRERRRDPQRSRGDGARAPPTRGRHDEILYAEATTAHLFVESPTERVGSHGAGILEFSSWFNTHPPMRSRIAALEQAGGFRLPERLPADEPFADELARIG